MRYLETRGNKRGLSKWKEVREHLGERFVGYIYFIVGAGVASTNKGRTSPLHSNNNRRIITIRKDMSPKSILLPPEIRRFIPFVTEIVPVFCIRDSNVCIGGDFCESQNGSLVRYVGKKNVSGCPFCVRVGKLRSCIGVRR